MTYDTKTVIVGNSTCIGRPIEWNKDVVNISDCEDENGKQCYGVKFITACHECGNAIEFTHDHVSKKCPECGIGEDKMIDEVKDLFPFQNPGNISKPC